ncbi:MAG TPA: caspase family protein [Casimicrobiaceae bacterium]|nr:caspase family protein [Casimicrobiaceae bacterium]
MRHVDAADWKSLVARRRSQPAAGDGASARRLREFALCALLASLPLLAVAQAAPRDERGQADRLLTVDCLLPGQVRQLGTSMTYLTPRRPVRTSVADCEVRGGEYVAYDRADYATALKVWQAAAEQGDKEAQTNLGEIYERGVGGAPDYEKAAFWYRKAADQGYARAQIDLGFLYEQGRGVAKDPAMALQLYRKAAGLNGTVSLESPNAANPEEVKRLRDELDRTRQELEKARRDLDQQRIQTSAEIERLTQRKMAAAAAGNADETRRLETLLSQRENELDERRAQVAKFERSADEGRQRLAQLEGESATMRRELEATREQLAKSQREIHDRQEAAVAQEQELEATRRELAQQKQDGATADAARAHALEADIARRNDELERQRQAIARLENQSAGFRNTVAKLETTSGTPAQDLAPPSIQILDPSVIVTRNVVTVKVRAGSASRRVVGHVAAPAGLASLALNGRAEQVDRDGFFTSNVPLAGAGGRVTLVATDRFGKRDQVELVFADDATHDRAPAARLDLGAYHALLIGEERYPNLPAIASAQTDVKELASVLHERYGFTVTTLLDATRYQILSELSRLAQTLGERDNLLVYYVGHGKVDDASHVAYWLPVDAGGTAAANWISSDDVTRMIGPMRAKHVLVVADSCYSGLLSRSSISEAAPDATSEQRSAWLASVAAKKSRHLLWSGRCTPVPDRDGRHSLFASMLIEALTVNDDVLDGKLLGDAVAVRVLRESRGSASGVALPDYRPIRFADNDGGEFLFPSPRASSQTASTQKFDAAPARN